MLTFKPHKAPAFQLAFSPDGASIATCGTRPVVCVSDAATGKRRWECDAGRNTGLSIGLGLAYSPDGTQLAVVSWVTVSVFAAESGATRHTYPGTGYAVAFTPDGSGVVTGRSRSALGAVRTDLRTGHTVPLTALDTSATFNRLRYSPDGRLLAAFGVSDLTLVDVETDRRAAWLPIPNSAAGVGALAFHPRAPVLVYSGGPKLIVYDLEARSQIAARVRSRKYIQDAAFTPDGRHLLTVSNDATAVLWETAGWTEVREFAWDIGQLKAVAVVPDGTRAACASDRGRVVVWDLDL